MGGGVSGVLSAGLKCEEAFLNLWNQPTLVAHHLIPPSNHLTCLLHLSQAHLHPPPQPLPHLYARCKSLSCDLFAAVVENKQAAAEKHRPAASVLPSHAVSDS